jgi:hypothetical protein
VIQCAASERDAAAHFTISQGLLSGYHARSAQLIQQSWD